MKANYHTHTARCGHAEGSDESYVLAALKAGYDVLGFSDHVPWPYKNGADRYGTRMRMGDLQGYLASVRGLREKYEGKIRLLLGFECEYFPDYIDWLAEMREQEQLDYLILGNHFERTDEAGGFYFAKSKTAAQLRSYVDLTLKGIETGMFSYLAHPDLFMRSYGSFDDNCRAAIRELARACKAADLPMEYNLHDRFIQYRTNRISYPNPEAFDIIAGEGVRIIVGIDAHEPAEISNPAQMDRAQKELARFGDLVIGHLDL